MTSAWRHRLQSLAGDYARKRPAITLINSGDLHDQIERRVLLLVALGLLHISPPKALSFTPLGSRISSSETLGRRRVLLRFRPTQDVTASPSRFYLFPIPVRTFLIPRFHFCCSQTEGTVADEIAGANGAPCDPTCRYRTCETTTWRPCSPPWLAAPFRLPLDAGDAPRPPERPHRAPAPPSSSSPAKSDASLRSTRVSPPIEILRPKLDLASEWVRLDLDRQIWIWRSRFK